MVYFKTTNEDGYIVEWTGEMFKKNSVKNIYNKWGQLLETSTFVEPFKFHYKSYYENTNPSIIQEENTQWIGEMYDGTYKANYKDGMPKVIGHFSDRVRDSVWTFYDEDGTLTRIKFKKYQETYPNGKIKVRGSKFYDDKTQAWLPDYDWWYYKENGDIEKMEKYKFGVLQEN